jgi:hypothetical protein
LQGFHIASQIIVHKCRCIGCFHPSFEISQAKWVLLRREKVDVVLDAKMVSEPIEDVWGEVPPGHADHVWLIHTCKSEIMFHTPLPLEHVLQIQFIIE